MTEDEWNQVAAERQGLVNEFCRGRLSHEQGRLFVMSDEEIISARRENNIKRPSFHGALIDDLLTTIMVERMERRKDAQKYAAIVDAMVQMAIPTVVLFKEEANDIDSERGD